MLELRCADNKKRFRLRSQVWTHDQGASPALTIWTYILWENIHREVMHVNTRRLDLLSNPIQALVWEFTISDDSRFPERTNGIENTSLASSRNNHELHTNL
jgi:hypothetical protein